MPNVRIEATGEVDLSVAVNLGPNERKVHSCPVGENIELTVGGNQTLTISAVENESGAEAEDAALPVGAGIDELPVAKVDPPVASDFVSDTPIEVGDPLKNPFDDGQ